MEQVKKLRIRGSGREKTKEYVLFQGDAMFVTENVVCLSGPVTDEEHIIVTLEKLGNNEKMNYMIGKSVKLGFLIQDYSDRSGIPKLEFRFVFEGKRVTEDQTPKELGLENGDSILVFTVLRG